MSDGIRTAPARLAFLYTAVRQLEGGIDVRTLCGLFLKKYIDLWDNIVLSSDKN